MVVTKNIRFRIENDLAWPGFFDVSIPSIYEMVHCFIRVIRSKIYLKIRCSSSCVACGLAFSTELKFGEKLLQKQTFQKVLFCSDVVSLTNSSLDEIRNVCSQNGQSATVKLYLELVITMKYEKIIPIQRLFVNISDPELADFTFEIDDHKIPAHKFILSARSPVFRRMLSTDCYKETQESVMKITDTSVSTFQLFLQFIYKASVPNLAICGAVDLIKLAEKYDVADLKDVCEKVLYRKLYRSDCLWMYMFAHQYNCSQELIREAFRFVRGKYFTDKNLPPNLYNNPDEVQRMVTQMELLKSTPQEELNNPSKKPKMDN